MGVGAGIRLGPDPAGWSPSLPSSQQPETAVHQPEGDQPQTANVTGKRRPELIAADPSVCFSAKLKLSPGGERVMPGFVENILVCWYIVSPEDRTDARSMSIIVSAIQRLYGTFGIILSTKRCGILRKCQLFKNVGDAARNRPHGVFWWQKTRQKMLKVALLFTGVCVCAFAPCRRRNSCLPAGASCKFLLQDANTLAVSKANLKYYGIGWKLVAAFRGQLAV